MPTVSTAPVIILLWVLWRMTKGEILSMVLFLSIFQAASALNLGDMGVAPWILALVLGLLIKLCKGHAMPSFISGTNNRAVRLLLLFAGYALFSGVAYPFFFHGVPVQSSHDSSLAPLTWGIANVAQACYLLAAIVIFLTALLGRREALRSSQIGRASCRERVFGYV